MNLLVVKVVLLIALLQHGGADDDFSILSDELREDLFNIYTGAALVEKGVTSTHVEPEKVQFVLYTKNNRDEGITLDITNPQEFDNKQAPIVFIIHGWLESKEKQWYEDLKNSFLQRNENYYVVQVDWSEYSLLPYSLSSYSTRDVGKVIGTFIVDIHRKQDIPLENFLVVGHSLGGQTAGFVGKTVQELINQKLSRLVALDPAGPLFTQRPEDERLNPTDAEIVHVIHTNGGVFGYEDSCGTIDFFPNGGSWQSGCGKLNILNSSEIDILVVCDHQRSWVYFIEAVANPDGFKSIKCNSYTRYLTKYFCDDEYANMGDLETKQTGNFYLETNGESPFSKDGGDNKEKQEL